jgi:benzoyl-CoA reductase subunit B
LLDRIKIIEEYINDFDADGFVLGSIKSCNGFSACQLAILKEVEQRTNLPGVFIEYDIVDSRYYSLANIKVRMESHFEMLEERMSRKASWG